MIFLIFEKKKKYIFKKNISKKKKKNLFGRWWRRRRRRTGRRSARERRRIFALGARTADICAVVCSHRPAGQTRRWYRGVDSAVRCHYNVTRIDSESSSGHREMLLLLLLKLLLLLIVHRLLVHRVAAVLTVQTRRWIVSEIVRIIEDSTVV